MQTTNITFTTTILKFAENADKTGWTYIVIYSDLAQQLKPANKKAFKVKGSIDAHTINAVSVLPMGDGQFLLPINAPMRKAIAKKHGASVNVKLMIDESKYTLNADFLACLQDDPSALAHFETLTTSHQNYFSKWIDAAKTEPTKEKRITQSLYGLSNKMDYGQMIRFHQGKD